MSNFINVLREKYHMTLDDAQILWDRQLGECPCGRKLPTIEECITSGTQLRWGVDLVVDHDWTTGLVRGLMHHRCNGILQTDDPRLMANLTAYLFDPPATEFEWKVTASLKRRRVTV